MIRNLSNKGFSMIELIIVVIIIGILGTLVGPRLMSNIGTSKLTTISTNVKTVERAVAQYYSTNNTVPTQAQLDGQLSKTLAEMGITTYAVDTTTAVTGVPAGDPTVTFRITKVSGVTTAQIRTKLGTAAAATNLGIYDAGATTTYWNYRFPPTLR